jgi:hypothetical protein
MIIFRIFLLFSILFLSSCGQAGWSGYYQTYPKTTVNKYIAESVINSTSVTLKNKESFWLELPRDCSGFKFAGIITPFTPPIPLFWFRSWNDGACGYLIAQTRSQATLHLKIIDSKTKQETVLEPTTSEGRWGYTKHIFPIRAKNIDSGSIIIEKDGEKIEVPFEYKYFKFWY